MTTLEKMARAIHDAQVFADIDYDAVHSARKSQLRLMARAALEALREPSAGMIVAAREKADLINYPITDPWEVMLRHILEESE